MRKNGLLIIEDEDPVAGRIRGKAEDCGFELIWRADSVESAERMWEVHKADISVIVLDLKLQDDNDGWVLLDRFRRDGSLKDDFEVLIYSGTFRHIEKALDAIRSQTIGLYKKNADEDRLWKKLESLAKRFTAPAAIILSREEEEELDALSESSIPVLIYGPPGSGKTTRARELAVRSGCDPDRIMPINCANLTAELADALLFGAVKGAFTGANYHRAGKLMRASGFTNAHLESNPHLPVAESPKKFKAYKSLDEKWGAVILDEIATLDPAVQAKLLLVLEGEPIQPLGWSGRTTGFLPNFRIIAVSNEIEKLSNREGSTFRPDLLRRLTSWAIECQEVGEENDDKVEQIINETKIEMRSEGRVIGMVNPRIASEALKWLVAKKSEIFGGYRELQWIVQRAWLIAKKRSGGSSREITLEAMQEAWEFSSELYSQFEMGAAASPEQGPDAQTLDRVNNLRQKVAEALGMSPDELNQGSFGKAIKDAISQGADKERLKETLKSLFLANYGERQKKKGYVDLGMAVKYETNSATPDNVEVYGRNMMGYFTSLFR